MFAFAVEPQDFASDERKSLITWQRVAFANFGDLNGSEIVSLFEGAGTSSNKAMHRKSPITYVAPISDQLRLRLNVPTSEYPPLAAERCDKPIFQVAG
jgi:hypothetical protein